MVYAHIVWNRTLSRLLGTNVPRIAAAILLLTGFLLTTASRDQYHGVFKGPAALGAQTSRMIVFSEYDWIVRSSTGPTAPGGNTFTDAPDRVWVDHDGRLHLSLDERATEIRSRRRGLGYGTYELRLSGRVDRLHPRAVFGFFTFELPSNHPYHREIDIEFSRWDDAETPNAQFVVQPAGRPENHKRFVLTLDAGIASTHRFEWRPGSVSFTSWHGHAPYPPEEHVVAARFTVEGEHVPTPQRERVHLNFWWYQGPPEQAPNQEIVVDDFRFIPAEGN